MQNLLNEKPLQNSVANILYRCGACKGTRWHNPRKGHEGPFLTFSVGSPRYLLPFLGDRAPYTWEALTETRLSSGTLPFLPPLPSPGLLCPCGLPYAHSSKLAPGPSCQSQVKRTVSAPRPLTLNKRCKPEVTKSCRGVCQQKGEKDLRRGPWLTPKFMAHLPAWVQVRMKVKEDDE